jgi:predicted membrane protein
MIGRLVAGLALLAIGTVFLLYEAGAIDEPGRVIGSWWPAVFVVIGVALAVEQRRFGTGPLFFVALGVVLLAATTDIVGLEVRVVWPAVLIVIGAWLLLPGSRGTRSIEDSRMAITAVFEDRKVRTAAITFEQATVTTIFGDVDLDLRDTLPGGDMTVDITVICGDVDVMVPKGWRVVMAASSVFADIDHLPAPQPVDADSPVLRVRGFSIFGDVKVRQ